ncbi:Curved DNA-binding protein [Roseimaritima multifibrata]|uniref:Curved DNA-binding protein n=1 Tax=Roseimaritima multifibrata TaxID=1930274 RepID=A0A517ME59_9BACT|nr:DnaJ C-terminal domain-containing protein [Roseimaritima multifibrata]QDS93174.1 Curved DNA-binding protein [Roseimaritima multifibrata]
MAEDLYQVLGVGRDASKDEIQKAYRKMARKYHPDMNPDNDAAREKFKRVQEAYDVLSNEEQREGYNRYGADYEKMRSGGYQPGQAAGGTSFDGLDLEQIFGRSGAGGGGRGGFQGGFGDFFEQLAGGGGGGRAAGGNPFGGGGRGRPQPPQRGANQRHELTIPFQTAVKGGKTEFYLTRSENPEKLSVTIPPGVSDGDKVRLRGKGAPSPNGGERGDLILVLSVGSHPFYRRNGNHLELDLPITLKEAALGTKVDLPTPAGVLTLTVPAGSSGGKRLRLKGQGIAGKNGKSGDLLVQLQIQLPSEWSEEDQALIEQLDERHPLQPRESLEW